MGDTDLGALCAQATRRLIAAERPLLARHGISMWEYIALSRLAAGPVGSQLELAEAIGYDKTRLIALLDGLEQAGLISRHPDPGDRRARLVALTSAGARRQRTVQRAIRAMEERLLDSLAPAQRAELRTGLALLAGAEAPEA